MKKRTNYPAPLYKPKVFKVKVLNILTIPFNAYTQESKNGKNNVYFLKKVKNEESYYFIPKEWHTKADFTVFAPKGVNTIELRKMQIKFINEKDKCITVGYYY